MDTARSQLVQLPRQSSPEKRKPSVFWVLASLALPPWALAAKYRFTPDSKLPRTGPFILSPNHMSEIDPIAMGVAVWKLGRVPRFMAKASLFKVPVLGSIMRLSGQIPVVREAAAGGQSEGSPISAATKLIAKQGGVIIYPEGSLTRDPDVWPMRGKTGAARLALESGIPLIPAAHWGVQEIMPRYGKKIRLFGRRTIAVAVGEPLDLSAYKGKPVTQEVITEVTSLLMSEITCLLEGLRGKDAPAERWDPRKHNQTERGRF